MRTLLVVILVAAVGLFAWYYFFKTEPGTPAEKAREAVHELKDDIKEKTHAVAEKVEEKTRSTPALPATQP